MSVCGYRARYATDFTEPPLFSQARRTFLAINWRNSLFTTDNRTRYQIFDAR